MHLDLIFEPSFTNALGGHNVSSTWTPAPPAPPGAPHPPGELRIVLHNKSKTWIDVVLQWGAQEIKTGHFNPGETRELVHDIRFVGGVECKMFRWAPGVFGVPGSGGGECRFVVPGAAGQAHIEMDVTEVQ
jgi:hypothetical protein